MASQMRRFSHASVIWSCDVLSPQVDTKKSAEYSAELQQGKVEGDLLVPILFTYTENRTAVITIYCCTENPVNNLQYTGLNFQNSTFFNTLY
jgi:hypothetical protein